jgi:hypothetical protein
MENQDTKMSQIKKISEKAKVNIPKNKVRKNDLFDGLDILAELNMKTMEELNKYENNCWEQVNSGLSDTTRELLGNAYGIDYGYNNDHTINQKIRMMDLNSCEMSIYKLKQTFDQKTGQPTNKPRIYKL